MAWTRRHIVTWTKIMHQLRGSVSTDYRNAIHSKTRKYAKDEIWSTWLEQETEEGLTRCDDLCHTKQILDMWFDGTDFWPTKRPTCRFVRSSDGTFKVLVLTPSQFVNQTVSSSELVPFPFLIHLQDYISSKVVCFSWWFGYLSFQ